MGTTRDLLKLYDLIQCGDIRCIENFLKETPVAINEVLLCKGIGVLHLAVGIDPIEKSRECTELLLKHGADPNLCNEDGITPVHIAAIWGRLDNLKLLIACGGDPLRHDFDGLSAFDYAAREEQWDVFDYFHNVVDEKDDSFESPCAYSFDLERVLVTTDQMVAEYEPLSKNQINNTTRKSDMVRQWCDKNSLVMNKLYPTILTDTFTVEDPDWRSINITKNITLDLTNDVDNTHNDTYKTCQSKVSPVEVEVSGVKPLDFISDESSKSEVKKRFSVYENFSLPGSPNSIIHRNYNSKSSLKKKTFDSSQSLFTEDSTRSQDLDRAMMVQNKTEDCTRNEDLDRALVMVQNKTNEWLSSNQSDCKETVGVCNTRRSSASSGVSSHVSGGSIVIANIEEEYKYEDKEENVVLIEKRLLVSSVILPIEDESPDNSIVSVASSLPPSVDYDNNTLRMELLKLGYNAGPIQDSTRKLYLKKLQALKKNPILATNTTGKGKCYSVVLEQSLRSDDWMKNLDPYIELETKAREDFANPKKKWREGAAKASFTYLLLDPRLTANLPARASKQSPHETWKTFVSSIFYVGKGYSVVLEQSLRSDDWMKNLDPYIELETKAREDFANPKKKWREGAAKASFTYLLLDPRLTANLPARASKQSPHETWKTFVSSIFYVGKGKRTRPYSHLYQALTLWKRDFTTSPDKKVQNILEIWSNKLGVICLHVFLNVIPAEAYTYEASMIDVIGVNNLTNQKVGNYYGVVDSWPLKERRKLGLYLLYKAMQIFLSEGERQLRPEDID